MPEQSAQIAALKSGQIDLMFPSAESRLQLKGDSNIGTVQVNSTNTVRLNINTNRKPFDNPDVRRAISLAIDRAAVAQGAFLGEAVPSAQVPPSYTWAPKMNTMKYHKHDVAQAKALLAKAGYPNGFEVNLNHLAGYATYLDRFAELLKTQLAQVGIKAKLEQRDPSLYFRSDIGVPTNVKAKGYGIMAAGWSADYPTPAGYLQVLVDGRLILPSGNSNYSELNSKEINDLIDKAALETDPTKNAAIWTEINKLVMENASLLPFTADKALNYRNPRLTNVFYNEYYGYIDWAGVGVQA